MLTGISGLFGGGQTTSGPQIYQLDQSLLLAYMSKDRYASALAAQSDTLGFGPAVAPWEAQIAALEEGESNDLSSKRLLSQAALIDLDDPDINRDGIDEATKNLFAINKALNRMQDLAEFAANDPSAKPIAALLDKQWQRYEAELIAFVDSLDIDGITLLGGTKTDTTESEALSPKERAGFNGLFKFSNATAEITDIDPNATFTMSAEKTDGSIVDVVIDLSGMGADTRNVVNIVNFVNAQLDGTEIYSRLDISREEDGRAAIAVQRSLSEELTFVPTTTEGAVYVAGTSGSGDNASAVLQKVTGIEGTPETAYHERQAPDEDGGADAQAVAVDSKGNVYVVGKTTGDLAGQVNQGAEDLYLTKYDAAGIMLWTRMLGANESAAGFALAIDGDDNAIVAGKVQGELYDTATGGSTDSFVTKFNESGQELWTRQSAPAASDGAIALTVDASNNIFLGGFTSGALSGQTHAGGTDAYVTMLDGDGGHLATQQFGGAGNETATGLAVHGGHVYVTGHNGGQGFVTRFDAATLALDAGFAVTLGAGGETTTASAITISSGGQILVAGTTTDAAMTNAGGDGRAAHQGGSDAFVANIDAATGTISWTSYLGTTDSDSASAIALNGSYIYVSGSSTGDLFGEPALGSKDGFVLQLDKLGVAQWVNKFSGYGGSAVANGLAVDAGGASIITQLGLPHGELPVPNAKSVTANSSVREGQSFSISIDGGLNKKITVREGDSFRWLAFQLNSKLEGLGQARLAYHSSTGEILEIQAFNGARISIIAGPEGSDALTGLGIKPMTLYGEPPKGSEDEQTEDSIFTLGFIGNLSLANSESAISATEHLQSALLKITNAWKFLNVGEEDELQKKRNAALLAPPPEYLAKKIAAYEEALKSMQRGF